MLPIGEDQDDGNVDIDLDFTKAKKKKKKKPFTAEDLDSVDNKIEIPQEGSGDVDGGVDDSFDLELDFSLSKKKKKTKKPKNLDDLIAETEEKDEDQENGKEHIFADTHCIFKNNLNCI